MQLMLENDGLEQEVFINESNGTKQYYIRGIWSTIGEKNRNGRIYSMELWKREVDKYQSVLSSGSINSLMEYEHPPRSKVDPMAAVSKVNKLYIEGKYVMGEAVLLDNTKANQLKTLIDNKIKISVSSRALGSVGRFGRVTEFGLITYDVVPEPSDFNATMNGMCESYQLDNGIVQGLDFDVNGIIVVDKSEANQYIESRFSKMLAQFGKL